MKNKKIFILLTMLLAFQILLSGCGIRQDQAVRTDIEYVSMWQENEPGGLWWKEMADKYEKQTGIHVTITFAGRDILTKIKSRMIMNDPPDLIDQSLDSIIASYLYNGNISLMPLDDFMEYEKGPEGQDKMMDIFNKDILELFKVDGKNYFVPYELMANGFFYNKSLFEQYNLMPPKTLTDFFRLNDYLKAVEIAPLALDGTITNYTAYYYVWACIRIIGPGSFIKAAKDISGTTWDEPGYRKAAEIAYELGKNGKNYFQEGYEGSTWPIAQADWAMGKSGSILCGSWIPVETSKQASEDMIYGFYPFPLVEGGEGKLTDVMISAIGCAIPKESKNFEMTKAFIKFVLKKENAHKFSTDTIAISTRNDLDYPAVLSDIKPYITNGKDFVLIMDGCARELPEWLYNVFVPLDNELLFGRIKPDNFIKQLKIKTVEYWNSKK